MKTAMMSTLAVLALSAPAGAQGLLRQHIDNALNKAESVLGNDSAEHDARSLSDLIGLRDTEMERMLQILGQKAAEREEAAQALRALGGTPPEPRIIVPDATLQDPETGRKCLTTLSGVPIACW